MNEIESGARHRLEISARHLSIGIRILLEWYDGKVCCCSVVAQRPSAVGHETADRAESLFWHNFHDARLQESWLLCAVQSVHGAGSSASMYIMVPISPISPSAHVLVICPCHSMLHQHASSPAGMATGMLVLSAARSVAVSVASPCDVASLLSSSIRSRASRASCFSFAVTCTRPSG